MPQVAIEKTTNILKLLSDPTRFRILRVLLSAERELCVNEIAHLVSATQSATSHQLAKLEDNNIVECFRRGKTMCYELTTTKEADHVRKIMKLFI